MAAGGGGARYWTPRPTSWRPATGASSSATIPTRFVAFAEAAQKAEATHGTLSAVGSYTPPKLGGEFKGAGVGISPAYSYTACVAEVEVDPETYDIKVEKLWVAHDCGRALNPTLVEGQIEGSAYMGFGEAIFEEQVFRKGLHKAPSLLEYKLPTIYDTPEIIAMHVETMDREGPYGAKEAGEGPLNPIIPAIANAVYDAIGARVESTPITPDKIARALKEQQRRLAASSASTGAAQPDASAGGEQGLRGGADVMNRLPTFEYRAARTVEEALAWLGESAGVGEKDPEARVMLMAGGTDVLPNMKHRHLHATGGRGIARRARVARHRERYRARAASRRGRLAGGDRCVSADA